MTQPKLVRCEGSGHEVYGPDEPTGTVQCLHSKCGRSDLVMKTTVIDGIEHYSVPDHKRRANPFHPKGAKKASRPRRTLSRDSGRKR